MSAVNMEVGPQYIQASEAHKQLTGQPLRSSTVWIYTRRGVKGVVLQGLIVNGRFCCTLDQMREFLTASTAARMKVGKRPGRPKGSKNKVKKNGT